MKTVILDLATTSTLLHERVSKYSENESNKIGLVYFNEKKYNKSNLKNRFFISFSRELNNDEEDEAKLILFQLESEFNITLSEALYLDRYRKDDVKHKKMYLSFLYQINKFLLEYKPKIVIGEVAEGFQVLAYYLCKRLDINYLVPANTYAFPKPRMVFYDKQYSDYYINLISKNKKNSDSNTVNYQRLIVKRQKIDINKGTGTNIQKIIDLNLFKRLFYNISNYSKTDYRESLVYKFNKKCKNIFNKIVNWVYFKLVSVKIDEKFNYIYFPLHIQPETTPDTIATYLSNQYEIARNVSLSLPDGYKLLIKEHPNDIGCRNIFELLKYNKLPNTYFVSHDILSKDIIVKSDLVVTICGNAAIEAVLFNKKAIVFSNIYYNSLSGIHRLKNYKELKKEIPYILNDLTEINYKLEVQKLYKRLYDGSFPCFWHQPFLANDILNEENVKNIYKSISTIQTVLES